jgi:uncharacterized protein with NRDE domain
MCLILIAVDQHPEYPLVIAANRDEYYQRPTLPLHFWKDQPDILAGRDLEKGGTWFGINRNGAIAAVTNTRAERKIHGDLISRGSLVSDFLRDRVSVDQYLSDLRNNIGSYDGFNLLLGDNNGLYMMGTGHPEVIKLEPGLHGISNGNIGSNWPKAIKGMSLLKNILAENKEIDNNAIFALLADQQLSDTDSVSSTDDGVETNHMIVPIFIKGEQYGTRSSTILIQRKNGDIQIAERSFNEKAISANTVSFDLEINK